MSSLFIDQKIMKTVEISILGRSYQISCLKDEEDVLKACVALVDSRMQSLKLKGKLQSTEKIAIMVALTLARDFLNAGGITKEENIKQINAITTMVEHALDNTNEPQNNLF